MDVTKNTKSLLLNENQTLKTENRRLNEEIVSLKQKLDRSLSKMRHQDENISRFKEKSKLILETSESLEQTCLKQRSDIEFYKKEIDKVLNTNAEINLELDNVYGDLNYHKELLKKTEEERNMALESAEKLQEGMEKFKMQVKHDQCSEDKRYEQVLKEKEVLEGCIEEMKLEASKLQTRLKNLNKDLLFEKNSLKRYESQQKELVGQVKKGEEDIRALEADLGKVEVLRKENKRVNSLCGELRKKVTVLDAEVNAAKSKNESLEALVVRLNRNLKRIDLIKSNRTSLGKENVEKKEISRSKKASNAPMSKLGASSRSEVFLRGGDVCLRGGDVCKLYCGFEEDRQNYLQLIQELERRLMEAMVERASVEAQSKERLSQWQALQKEVQEKSIGVLVVEKELREKCVRVEMLERQVEEGERVVRSVSEEFERFKRETREKMEVLKEGRGKMEELEDRLRESERRMSEKEGRMEDLEREKRRVVEQLDEATRALAQSEEKCQGLQRNIDEIARTSNALKFEIKQCNDHSQIIMSSLEKEVKVKEEQCQQLERDKCEMEGKMADLRALLEDRSEEVGRLRKQMKCSEVDAKAKIDYLSDKNEEVEMLRRGERGKEMMIEELRKGVKTCERQHAEWKRKMAVVLEERDAEVREARKSHAVVLEELPKLRNALKEKEQVVLELSRKNREVAEGKKKVLEEMAAEIKNLSKDFKQEKKHSANILKELESLKTENAELAGKVKEGSDEVGSLRGEYGRLQRDIIVRINDNKNLANELERLNTQLKILNLNLNGEVKKNMDARRELSGMKKDLLSHKTRIEELKYEEEQNEVKINRLNEMLTEKTIELEKNNLLLTKMSFDSKEVSSGSEQKKRQLEVEVMRMRKEMKERDDKLKTCTQEVIQLRDEVVRLKKQVEELEEKNAELKRKSERCMQEKESFEHALNAFKLESSHFKSGLDAKKRREEEMRCEIESLKDELKSQTGDMKAVRGECKEMQQKVSTLSGLLKVKESEVVELQAGKKRSEERCKTMEQEYKRENEKLKTELIDFKIEKNHLNLKEDHLNYKNANGHVFQEFNGLENYLETKRNFNNNENDFSLLSCNSAIIDDIFSLPPSNNPNPKNSTNHSHSKENNKHSCS